eukprot:TRINITY_DN83881_c0_g1_i1.p1 TRINITY_DN83881_c0_g1~~TRINITY_DN83881_c0_g1_i1.p1  ORF type:complete len:737 (-),score=199.93 TRINITY_DN83881_c0_g1_i1:145-2355(-)
MLSEGRSTGSSGAWRELNGQASNGKHSNGIHEADAKRGCSNGSSGKQVVSATEAALQALKDERDVDRAVETLSRICVEKLTLEVQGLVASLSAVLGGADEVELVPVREPACEEADSAGDDHRPCFLDNAPGMPDDEVMAVQSLEGGNRATLAVIVPGAPGASSPDNTSFTAPLIAKIPTMAKKAATTAFEVQASSTGKSTAVVADRVAELRSMDSAMERRRMINKDISQGGDGIEATGQKSSKLDDAFFTVAALVPEKLTKNQQIRAHAKRSKVFQDPSDLKKEVRAAVAANPDPRAALYNDEGCAGRISLDQRFESLTMLVILINAAWIGYEVDSNDAEFILDADTKFIVVENIFCAFFSFELAVRFMSLRKTVLILKDHWMLFDGALVFLMIWEVWAMPCIASLSEKGIDALAGTSMLRMVKLVRLTRVSRLLRLLRMIPEMTMLCKGIVLAMRGAIVSLVMMTLIAYMFAVLLAQLSKDADDEREYYMHSTDYWSSVPLALMTVMVAAIVPDLHTIIAELAEEDTVKFVFFLIYLFLVGVTLLNMFVGVMVQVVWVTSSMEKEEYLTTVLYDNMMDILRGADADENETICLDEFTNILLQPQTVRFLTSMDIDVLDMVEHLHFLFKGGKNLDFHEVIALLLDMRGSNACTVKDIVALRSWMSSEMDELTKRLQGDMTASRHAQKSNTAIAAQITCIASNVASSKKENQTGLLKPWDSSGCSKYRDDRDGRLLT